MPGLRMSGAGVTVNGPSSGTASFAGAVTLEAGTLNGGSGTINFQGDFSQLMGGTFNANNGTVTLTGGASTVDVPTVVTFNNLTVNKSTNNTVLTIPFTDRLVVNGTLTLTNGQVSTGTLEAKGAVNLASGFDGGNAAFIFSGTGNQTYTIDGTATTGMVTVNKPSTIALGLAGGSNGSYSLGGLTISSGVFNAPSGTLTLAGDLIQTGGRFNANGGKVKLSTLAVATLDAGEGGIHFNDLEITTAGKTVRFTAGDLFYVDGTWTVTGVGGVNNEIVQGSLVRLESTESGTRWKVNPSHFDISFVGVRDSYNVSAVTISPRNSLDRGNTAGWFVVPPPPIDLRALIAQANQSIQTQPVTSVVSPITVVSGPGGSSAGGGTPSGTSSSPSLSSGGVVQKVTGAAQRAGIELDLTSGNQTMAVSNDQKTAYVTDVKSNQIQVLNLDRGVVSKTITTTQTASQILVSGDGKYLFLYHEDTASVSKVNIETGTEESTIQLQEAQYNLSLSADGQLIVSDLTNGISLAMKV